MATVSARPGGLLVDRKEIRAIKRVARAELHDFDHRNDMSTRIDARRERHCFWTWPWGHTSWRLAGDGCKVCGHQPGGGRNYRCSLCGSENHRTLNCTAKRNPLGSTDG